jgi:hypothetical protein
MRQRPLRAGQKIKDGLALMLNVGKRGLLGQRYNSFLKMSQKAQQLKSFCSITGPF